MLCIECGRPVPASDGSTPQPMCCSNECDDANTERARAEGRIVELSDLTRERVSEMLGEVGLSVSGAGPVVRS